jgi:glycyl-tRNA synthetase
MAEIEHFVDPDSGKKHERFDEVKDIQLSLLDRHTQLAGKATVRRMPIGDAVEEKVINNETLAYFLGCIHLFLTRLGIEVSKLRFRQHLANEMAHYACDCWDAELLTSYGWIECVGCADRSAYDLTVHAARTGERLVVKEQLPEPLRLERWVAFLDKKKLGPTFRRDAKTTETAVAALDQVALESLSLQLENDGEITLQVPELPAGKVQISSEILKIERISVVENVREYTPNLIEPSFGIGRILYSLLEQVYWYRPEDVARGVSQPT